MQTLDTYAWGFKVLEDAGCEEKNIGYWLTALL